MNVLFGLKSLSLSFLIQIFASSLFAEQYPYKLPTKFEDYPVIANLDSLEKVVYAQQDKPIVYLHGLLILEMSRFNVSNKFGQDLDTIKVLAEQQKSGLGLVMYAYLKVWTFQNRDLGSSVQLANKGIQYVENQNDTLGMILMYSHIVRANIGSDERPFGNIADAKVYLDKIIKLGEQNVSPLAQIYIATTYLYFNRRVTGESNLNKETAIFNEALKLTEKYPQYQYLRHRLYTTMGSCYFLSKDYKRQLECNLKVYEWYKDNNSKFKILPTANLAGAYLLTGQYAQAEKYYLEAIKAYKETKEDRVMLLHNIYKRYSISKYREKKYEDAWLLRDKADSLNNIAQEKLKSKDLFDVQTKYETEKKELENKKLHSDAEKQQLRNLFLSIVALSMFVFLGIIFFINRKIRVKNTELTRLNELTASQNQELSSANRRMEHFTYALSHDALSYINHILNYTTLSQETTTDTAQQPILRDIYRNASRLKSMSKNLIGYNRVRRNTHLENTDLNDVVAEVIEDISVELHALDVQLKVNPLPIAYANREFVKEVVGNLLKNALKFRKHNVPLQIDISEDSIDDKYVKIGICDNGIGISAEKLPHIFKEFVKINDETEGSGLGLFIARQILETIGGRIWVESQQGEGSTFYFTLPKAQIPPSV